MKKNKLNLLLHPFFIVSIILLLLNDISWKHEYHNWLTGKLSDFTGMFALPIFFYAVFSNNKKFIFICSGLFFICWKTELSEPILITVNYFLPVSISRVIDYSDLSALAMLLPAYHLREPNFSFSYRSHMIKLIAICSLFIFCHTSMIRSLYYPYRENEVRLNHDYTSRKTEMEIQQKLKQLGINYYLDSIRYYPVKDHEFSYLILSEKDSLSKWVPVKNNNDSLLFIRRTSSPFYVIPEYIFEIDTLKNVEFSIFSNGHSKKPSTVRIESFRGNQRDYYQPRNLRGVKKSFKKFFE